MQKNNDGILIITAGILINMQNFRRKCNNNIQNEYFKNIS